MSEKKPTVRAKFRCTGDDQSLGYGGKPGETPLSHNYRFMPMYQPDVPEDQRYAKATPGGKLEMTVDNPAVSFEIGRDYYLDFIPVDES